MPCLSSNALYIFELNLLFEWNILLFLISFIKDCSEIWNLFSLTNSLTITLSINSSRTVLFIIFFWSSASSWSLEIMLCISLSLSWYSPFNLSAEIFVSLTSATMIFPPVKYWSIPHNANGILIPITIT